MTQIATKAERLTWAEKHRDHMAALGLQAVFCKTVERDGKRSPVPMAETTGSADFGSYVAPDKGYTRPAFRVPSNAIILDVDQKPGKQSDGAATLRAVVAELGPLPPTHRLTAHGCEQESGRLLFRVPDGYRADEQFFKKYGGAIDIVRVGHRFSMAPGDVHHTTGTEVICYGPDCEVADMPPVASWPMLPADWLMELAAPDEVDSDTGGLESVMSEHQARATIKTALHRIALHDTEGSGFRSTLMAASKTLGGFVGSPMYPTQQSVKAELYRAVRSLWKADPDADDMAMIESSLAIGAAAPWVVLASDEEKRREGVDPAVRDELAPVTIISDVQAYDWLRDEIGRNGLSGLFLRAGSLVKVIEAPIGMESVVEQHDGFQQLKTIEKPNQLVSYAQMCGYRFYTAGSRDTPPKAIFLKQAAAGVAIDSPEALPNCRTLKGVTGTPILRADGSVLDTQGYDSGSQLLYKPDSPDLRVPWVSDNPTNAEIMEARKLLEYMVADFSFTNDNQRATYLGALMLPFLRALIPPPYKLVAIDAHSPGSGKTMLAELLRVVHHGKRGGVVGGSFISEFPKGEELKKWATSVLMSGAGGVVHVDNVKSTIGGGQIEGLLTSASYGGRVLGVNEEVKVVNDRLWVVTGNNIQIGGDMARRVLWVRIDPGMEHPERRAPSTFQEKDLVGWVAANRGRLIWSVLTLARAWYVGGAELAEATSSDSFADATAIVQGILDHAGISGTFDPVEDREASSDEDDTADLLYALWDWQETLEGDDWLAAELAAAINSDFDEDLRHAIPDYWWRNKAVITPKSLGRSLAGVQGVPKDDLKLKREQVAGSKREIRWQVIKVS